MCATCGCDQPGMVKITRVQDMLFTKAVHHHPAQHQLAEHPQRAIPIHEHTHIHQHLDLERDILSKNNQLADRNRAYFLTKNITAFNLVSSPGSGKTSLLECTLKDLHNEFDFYVIEGDQQTTQDAERIASAGVPVVQINTGKGCHLDAQMITNALGQLKPEEHSVVFIENIGNLVCPSMFDLGEQKRIIIISVTEGEDKPLKYPDMFAGSQLCIINKIDLLPYLKFDLARLIEYAKRINPALQFIEVSCSSGEGLDEWYRWIQGEVSS